VLARVAGIRLPAPSVILHDPATPTWMHLSRVLVAGLGGTVTTIG
jgi:hypothetical protein